jgi:hypothetical protein
MTDKTNLSKFKLLNKDGSLNEAQLDKLMALNDLNSLQCYKGLKKLLVYARKMLEDLREDASKNKGKYNEGGNDDDLIAFIEERTLSINSKLRYYKQIVRRNKRKIINNAKK